MRERRKVLESGWVEDNAGVEEESVEGVERGDSS